MELYSISMYLTEKLQKNPFSIRWKAKEIKISDGYSAKFERFDLRNLWSAPKSFPIQFCFQHLGTTCLFTRNSISKLLKKTIFSAHEIISHSLGNGKKTSLVIVVHKIVVNCLFIPLNWNLMPCTLFMYVTCPT